MVNYSQSLDAVFSALSDPTRRNIVERLARGPLTVGQIAANFSISQPAISKHVRILEESGLLRRQIEWRVHHCYLSPGAIEAAAGWIETQRRFWNGALDRLENLLAQNPQGKKKRK